MTHDTTDDLGIYFTERSVNWEIVPDTHKAELLEAFPEPNDPEDQSEWDAVQGPWLDRHARALVTHGFGFDEDAGER